MQWQGKLVELNGCRYVVGKQLGRGGAGFVFELINIRSKLCLHVLKLYRSHREGEAGRVVSMEMTRHYYEVGGETRPPWLINIDLPGGIGQVQEYIGPYEPESPTRGLLEQAAQLLTELPVWAPGRQLTLGENDRKKASKAMDLCYAVLKNNPEHTVAISNLALAMAQLDDWNGAASMQRKALAIEPNHLLTYENAVRYSMGAELEWSALEQFNNMKEIFPYATALNSIGVALNLRCGLPDAARLLLGSRNRGRWQISVDEAERGRSESAPLIVRAKEALQKNYITEYVALLEEARARDANNPQLELNLGLAYQQAERYSDAATLLSGVLGRIPPGLVAVTAANAAFSEARGPRPQRALELLSIVYGRVVSIGDWAVAVSFEDLPGIATWVDEETVWQSSPGDASPIIDQLIAMVGGVKAVPERVADLAEFYQGAATTR
jgi:tetratricopeptide (TPR) repeat protein